MSEVIRSSMSSIPEDKWELAFGKKTMKLSYPQILFNGGGYFIGDPDVFQSTVDELLKQGYTLEKTV